MGHSGYMKSNLQCDSKKPRNNEVWVKDYSVQLLSLSSQMCPSCFQKLIHLKPMQESDNACGPSLFKRKKYPKYPGCPILSMTGFVRKGMCVGELDVTRCALPNKYYLNWGLPYQIPQKTF